MYYSWYLCWDRFHVTNVVTEKKVKVDGNINLCFEPSNCTEVLSFNDLPISYSNCSAAGSRPVFEGKWTVISIIKKILTYLGNLDFFLNFKTKPIYNVFVVFFF